MKGQRVDNHYAGEARAPSADGTFFVIFQTVLFAAVFLLTVAGSGAAKAAVSPLASQSIGGTLWQFLAAFAAATFVMVLLLRLSRGGAMFSVIFSLAMFVGLGTLLSALAGPSVAVFGTAAGILLYHAVRRVLVHDCLLVAGLAGVAIIVGGGLQPVAVIVILAILALYDIIAVYGTKHMVYMGRELLRRGATFVFIVPDRLSGLLQPLDDAGHDGRTMFLGTGDAVLPALLIAAVARTDPASAAYPAIGAIMGLWATLAIFFGKAGRKPMPALPPVALGAILGYVITILL